MLNILGKSGGEKFCDGLSRRGLLKIGGLALGGISLADVLKAEVKAKSGKSHKAVIMVFLPGGPPHQDMWDIKTDAPSEIRGEINPIQTNVPGIEIGELFPKIAGMMDKFVPIRSIVGAQGSHFAFQCLTGREQRNEPAGGWPSLGSWVSHLRGPADPAVPAYLSLSYKTGHEPWGDPGQSGFVGFGHAPFRLVGGRGDKGFMAQDMVLKDITLDRLADRRSLLSAFDGFRREADNKRLMEGMDEFTQQAFGVLTDSKLAQALDISQESEETRARYGQGDPEFRADGAPKVTENFLVARRLVEAGARVVTLNFSRWDWHGGNFKRAREDMPMLDGAVSSLVQDLHDRGLDRDVSVVVWGEFGRTPKINNNAGRDHWPRVSCALLAGGGMRTGQVIGSTNRLGEHAEDRPVHFQEVFATLYKCLGIDPDAERVFDLRGRPQYLVDEGYRPMRELV